jgi:GNAT superfamily N-acetyltransferase
MKLTIRPLTPDLWHALQDLFGEHGASNGCWCMYWRIGREYAKRPRAENRTAFRRVVRRGPPPGLLAFDGDLAVGWCQLTPRGALPILDERRVSARVDELPVWSLSCFYVRRGYRRKGVMAALISAAVKAAKRAKAPALEAYPYEKSQPVFVGGPFDVPSRRIQNRRAAYALTCDRAPSHVVTQLLVSRAPLSRHADDIRV